MSDKDARVRTMLEETREAARPHVEAMLEGARQTYMAAATLAGDPVTPENKGFWRIAGNLFFQGGLDPAGPEIAALVELSKAIATASNYEAWASSAAVCKRLFDWGDGGEELGLSDDLIDVNWTDADQRSVALQRAMQFHRVPRSYQAAVANVVAGIMLAPPGACQDSNQPPQLWATCCTYVVYAIAERVKAAEGIH